MDMFPDAKRITKVNKNPTKLVIIKAVKTGGTRLVGDLEGNHIIYFDGKSDFYETKANVFNVIQNWEDYNNKNNKNVPLDVYAIKYITDLNKHCIANGPIADYLTIDTVTKFEEIAKTLALMDYKKTAMGKSFNESDITLLPMGAGYGRLRLAFKRLYDLLEPCYSKCLIFIAHPKASSITVDGKELQAQDIALIGKQKLLIAADCDAIGNMYRVKGRNVNILSFKSSQQDLVAGARPEHLQNAEIEISEILDDGTFVSHWDKIFIKD